MSFRGPDKKPDTPKRRIARLAGRAYTTSAAVESRIEQSRLLGCQNLRNLTAIYCVGQ